MDSLTKGSGIAVSVLVAATASVLLLVPGHPGTAYWQGAGTSRGVMVASAEASPPVTAASQPVTAVPAGGAGSPATRFVVAGRPAATRPAVPWRPTAAVPVLA